jgi:hypothetical protein
LVGVHVTAQTPSYELQAAYVFNFAKYIQWPSEGEQLMIGVYNDNDVTSEFESTLKGKKVRGREIIVKKVVALEELLQCSILYVAESHSRNIDTLISSLMGKSILIVTEEDLIKKGAAISFVIEEERLRFKVKKKALELAALVASEGLLKLAILF